MGTTPPLPTGRVLVADIGGTHSRFATFFMHPTNGCPALSLALSLERRVVFRTTEQANLTELLSRLFQPQQGEPALLRPDAPPPLAAVLAIPAPTRGKDPFSPPAEDETCACPNIAWPIPWAKAAAVLGISRLHLVNDFVAQGFACAALPASLDLSPVLPGRTAGADPDAPIAPMAPMAPSAPIAPIALLGAGTGLGQALILPGERPIVLPSEGGHTLFPFSGAEEMRYAAFLHKARPHTPLIKDFILSGPGLAALYAFHTGREVPVEEVAGLLGQSGAAHDTVLAWYARFYARACREYILNTLPLGGLFITGGMASRVPVLDHPAFAAELCPEFFPAGIRAMLATPPLFHIRNQYAGLWGAAAFAAFSLCGPVKMVMAGSAPAAL